MRTRTTRWGVAAGVLFVPLALAGCLQVELAGADGELVSGAIVEGDPCTVGATTVSCHSSGPLFDPALGEVCLWGERRCIGGAWSACEDIKAIDVNMSIEGVLRQAVLGTKAACAGCDPDCMLTTDTPEAVDLGDPRLVINGVAYDAGIKIGPPGPAVGGRYAWVSSDDAGVVNKIDMVDRKNVGVYRTGLVDGDAPDPSRTTVDSQGYAYVGNRNGDSVLKIAGLEPNCVDRNGNGVIDTSTGEVPPGSKTFDLLRSINTPLDPGNRLNTPDECIIWNKGTFGRVRALAIDAKNRLWIGAYDEDAYYVMDISTGNTIAGPIAVGHHPYGAAIGSNGLLWSSDNSNDRIVPIDTNSAAPGPGDVGASLDPSCNVYGIVVDGLNRVFYGQSSEVGRYDPAAPVGSQFKCIAVGNGNRGLTVDSSNLVYVASAGSDQIIQVNGDTMATTGKSWAVGNNPLGACPGFNDDIWAANNSEATAARIDLLDDSVMKINTYGVNYIYSDFTGYGFATFTSPTASFTRIYDSWVPCGAGGVSFHSSLWFDTDTPDTTLVQFYAKAADTQALLAGAPEVYLGETPPDDGRVEIANKLIAAGQDPRDQFLAVKVQLSRNGSADSPIFYSMSLEEYCE